MTFQSTLGATLIAASCLTAAAAFAGGPAAPVATPVVAAPAAPAAPKPTLTFGFELTPEFYASDKAGSYSKGDLADDVAKFTVSKALPNNISVSGSLSTTLREPGTTGKASASSALEVGASYKFKLSDTLSVTPSATLGYGFGGLPKIDPANATASEAYYAVGLAADLKLNSALTWNVANLRYRDAFSVTWKTPKISTGVTYKLDDLNSAYANIGKSWKDTGAGYKSDKYSIAFGIKHLF